MNPHETELVALAAAVADGARVDWAHAESSAASDDERRVVDRLRHLADLFASARDAHRTWGPFELRQEIGRGSFGVVYRAWDTRLHRDVALKLLHAPDLDEPATSRVLEEGRLLARVHHPNIVTVFGADAFDGRVGIWMEYVAGQTLRDLVAQQGPLGPAEAVLVGRDVCRALTTVHQQAVLHRDVKAQNVMREQGGRTVLMDFGAGQPLAFEAAEIRLAGTPLYLAPEVLEGRAATVQSDLYSVGVLLYFLVSGDFPVVADSLDELRRAHTIGPRLLRDLRPNLPAAFLRCVESAAAPNPADRPQSAGELERLLDRALADDGATGVNTRRTRRLDRRTGFRAAWMATAAVVMAAAAITWFQTRATSFIEAPSRSVAILPFRNLTGDAANDYFSEGLTQDLVAHLAMLEDVRVISGASTRRFRNGDTSETDIASTLGVATVLEGSVRQAGDRVRIVSSLVDGRTGVQIWSESFERQRGDVFALQTEVARKIAVALRGELPAADVRRLASLHTTSVEAFDLYLKGRYYYALRTEDGLNRALQSFQDALVHDSSYAQAEAGLADAYTALASYAVLPRADAFRRAAEHAEKAVALDPGLAEAHASLGYAQKNRFDWAAADVSFRRALQLDPRNATFHHWYSIYLTQQGRFAEATTEIKTALAIDPLAIGPTMQLASLMMMARRYDEAVAQYRRALEMDPTITMAYRSMGGALTLKGDFDAARDAFERARQGAQAATEDQELEADRACMLARAGASEEALSTARALATRHDLAGERTAGSVAAIYAALERTDEAFAWLERAYAEHDPELGYLKVHPRWDPLRGERFSRLLARLGFN